MVWSKRFELLLGLPRSSVSFEIHGKHSHGLSCRIGLGLELNADQYIALAGGEPWVVPSQC